MGERIQLRWKNASLGHRKSERYTSGQMCLPMKTQKTWREHAYPLYCRVWWMASSGSTPGPWWKEGCGRHAQRLSVGMSADAGRCNNRRPRKHAAQTGDLVQCIYLATLMTAIMKRPPFKRKTWEPKGGEPLHGAIASLGSLADCVPPGNEPLWRKGIPGGGLQLAFLNSNAKGNWGRQSSLSRVGILLSHCLFCAF